MRLVQRGVRWLLPAVALVSLAVIAGCGTPAPGGGTQSGGTVQIDQRDTDSALAPDPFAPNFAIRPAGTSNGKLAVLFNGTGATPAALSQLGARLSRDGFYVVGLRYASAVSTQWACTDSQLTTEPECHRDFRSEITFGKNVADPDGFSADHPMVDVSASESVVNRLTKLVGVLHQRAPLDGWGQFQQRDATGCTQTDATYGGCAVDWSRVVTVGHSQGAGVALYLAKFFALDRVAMLSGPYDVFVTTDNQTVVASWITEGGFEVPASRMTTFSHVNDYGLAIHRAAADALGIPGPEVPVTAPRPFGFSNRLISSIQPGCPLDSAPAHNSTATDACATAPQHSTAWSYLATGS